jgi:hypothetical protein
MNRLESELFDLEELLMRNDGIADDGTYSTIVGIANDVSELEEENEKLRALVHDYANVPCQCYRNGVACRYLDDGACSLYDRAVALGVEVD